MANYRMEIDALNALIDEQRKTNELLERMILMNTQEQNTTVSTPENKPIQRRGRKKQ